MTRAALSRADLLRALARLGPEGTLPSSLLGFERRPLPETQPPPPERPAESPSERAEPTTLPDTPFPTERPRLEFLVPTRKDILQDEPAEFSSRQAPFTDEELRAPRGTAEPYVPLIPWPRLAPFLRRCLGRRVPSRRLDLLRLARLMTSGQPWRGLPYLPRLCWAPSACLLWDSSPEMEPYQPDVCAALRLLKRERGRQGLLIHQHQGPPRPPSLPPGTPVLAFSALGQLQRDDALLESWRDLGRTLHHAGHSLMALSPAPRRLWDAATAGAWPCAVWDRQVRLPRRTPAPRQVCPEPVAPGVPSPQAEFLLDLLSPATLVTPGLLRQTRLLLGPEADVGTEHEAWFHPDTTGRESLRYFCFQEGPDYHARLARLKRLAAEPETARTVAQAQDLIARWHEESCSVVIALEAAVRRCLVLPEDPLPRSEMLRQLGRAVERLREQAPHPGSREGHRTGLARWFFEFVEQRLSPEMREAPDFAPVLARGLALARKFLHRLEQPWPDSIDLPSALAELRRLGRGDQAIRRDLHLIASDQGLALVEARARPPRSFPIGGVSLRAPWVHVLPMSAPALSLPFEPEMSLPLPEEGSSRLVLETDLQRLTIESKKRPAWARRMWCHQQGVHAEALVDGKQLTFRWNAMKDLTATRLGDEVNTNVWQWLCVTPPKWASRFWADDFGLAAEFRVRELAFVLRWIPPGSFLMGSPEDEPGRYNNEGPQHEVRISRGFWMGETPVTQAQWRAVVEEASARRGLLSRLFSKSKLKPTPSHFRGPAELPVESVSWEDCTDFCRLLDALLPEGPGFRLPTEAQWEYACRAGSTEPPFFGPIEIIGENNAPMLDGYTWYGGNSGLEVEVKNPENSKEWPAKQYPHAQAGTHRVKQKAPNAQGLYDILGNVWECCRDAWDAEAYAKRPANVVDPVLDHREIAGRVVRGGSWGSLAEFCRAAIRDWFGPDRRGGDLGLRLSAGQEPRAAEPRERSDPRSRAERGPQPA